MRRKRNYSRDINTDIKYDSVAVSRFINYVMQDGKKDLARKIVYGALDIAEKKLKKPGIEIFNKAIENASPVYEVFSKRVGGANYQIPREVRPRRKTFLAYTWIINASKSAKGKTMMQKLADELIAVYNEEGEVMHKKENMHKMAEANKAFAHFARR